MPSRRGFIGTVIGGGLALPDNLGKIVEPTPAEVAQVMEDKTGGVAIVSGQEIYAEELIYHAEDFVYQDVEFIKDALKVWTLEVVFLNHLGERESIMIRPKPVCGIRL